MSEVIKKCDISTCTRRRKGLGYCDMHYQRFKKYGDALTVHAPTNRNPRDGVSPSSLPEYINWLNMKSRCYSPKDPRYNRYGGRGIIVCERWLLDFWNFYDDMGTRPTPKHTLDRKDTNGNYEPSNCKWSTVREQNANRSISNEVMGVGYYKTRGLWWAQLKINGRLVLNKVFTSQTEAIEARKEAERLYLPKVI